MAWGLRREGARPQPTSHDLPEAPALVCLQLAEDAAALAPIAKAEAASIGLAETHAWYDAEYTEHSKVLLTQDHATET